MVRLILPGKRLLWLLAALTFSFFSTYAQTSPASGNCAISAPPTQVRGEGLTERFGSIVFQCSGFIPSTAVSGNITVFLPVSVTNRVDTNNNALDAVLSVDTGVGLTPTAIPGKIAGNNITFQGLSIVVPANGNFNVQISNIRAAAFQSGLTAPHQLNAQISAPFALNQSSVTVATVQTGLYSTQNSAGIYCVGSPVPGTITMSNLFSAGTAFASTRLTEGFGTAFLPMGAGDDTGTRIIIGYSGFPAGASIYVPTFIAGSDAMIPTAGGDLGLSQNTGAYVPGSNTLLLSLVQFADATGVGGFVTGFSGSMDTVKQVTLTNGSGYAVYEVTDANPSILESAQFPTFIAIPSVTAPATANETVSFAPKSTVMAASATAPVPRFGAAIPPNDCSLVGDCNANYYPKLSASTVGLNLTATAGGFSNNGYIAVDNIAGGTLNWSGSVLYNQGSGWLTLGPSSGQNNGTITVSANAKSLAAGNYTATITVDGGPMAGNASFPLTLTVKAAATGSGSSTGSGTGTGTGPSATGNSVTVSSVVSAANFASAPLVAGSLTTLLGSNLAGKSVAVTFDGNPAMLLYTGASQINLQVPSTVASEATSSMVVTVDGSTATQSVPVSPAWPAIFNSGVLNQDGSVNGPTAPAAAGQVLQIFLTGMPDNAPVTVVVGNQNGIQPLYAGVAPGLSGVQQVNVALPAGAGGGSTVASTTMAICASAGGRQFCSTGIPVYVK
jgi:uncharacterized protein (TIGR03437 family)